MKIFRTWTFRWWEMALLKLGLIAFGLLLGIHLQSYLEGLLWLWWAVFAVSAAYFIGKMVQASDGGSKAPIAQTSEVGRLTKSEEAEIPEHTEKGL